MMSSTPHDVLPWPLILVDILTALLSLGNSTYATPIGCVSVHCLICLSAYATPKQHLTSDAFNTTTSHTDPTIPKQQSTRTVEMTLNSKLVECDGRRRARSPRAAASCSAGDEPSRRWSSRTRSRCGNRRSEHLAPGTAEAITTTRSSWRKRESRGGIAAAVGGEWRVGGGRGGLEWPVGLRGRHDDGFN